MRMELLGRHMQFPMCFCGCAICRQLQPCACTGISAWTPIQQWAPWNGRGAVGYLLSQASVTLLASPSAGRRQWATLGWTCSLPAGVATSMRSRRCSPSSATSTLCSSGIAPGGQRFTLRPSTGTLPAPGPCCCTARTPCSSTALRRTPSTRLAVSGTARLSSCSCIRRVNPLVPFGGTMRAARPSGIPQERPLSRSCARTPRGRSRRRWRRLRGDARREARPRRAPSR
mmetsp:Transcript_101779/g.283397  ORF Transcript_101779/g.283397 Transcript_101779/m.283397 type:complete len:229 (-) Transcript_101779:91-777(-)